MRRLPTAAEAAFLLSLNARRKEKDDGKEVSRLRLSDKTFRKITGRRRHHPSFLADLNECLLDYNWYLLLTGEAVGLHRASAVKGWPRINSQRIELEIDAARNGTLNWDGLNEELMPVLSEADDDTDDS